MASAAKLARQRSDHESNARAAAIILAEPEKYAGLPLVWAEEWAKLHGRPAPPKDEPRKTGPQPSLF